MAAGLDSYMKLLAHCKMTYTYYRAVVGKTASLWCEGRALSAPLDVLEKKG